MSVNANCFFEECENEAIQEWRGMYLCDDHMSVSELIDGLYEEIKVISPYKSFDSFVDIPEDFSPYYASEQDFLNVKFSTGYIRMLRILNGGDPQMEFKITMFKQWLFDHWGVLYPDADTKQSMRIYRDVAKKDQYKDERLSKPCVYILASIDIPGMYKIGMAKNLKLRLSAYSTHNPNKPTLVHVFYTENAKWLEDELHRQFAGNRKHGEWFRLSDENVIDAIDAGESMLIGGGK